MVHTGFVEKKKTKLSLVAVVRLQMDCQNISCSFIAYYIMETNYVTIVEYPRIEIIEQERSWLCNVPALNSIPILILK